MSMFLYSKAYICIGKSGVEQMIGEDINRREQSLLRCAVKIVFPEAVGEMCFVLRRVM